MKNAVWRTATVGLIAAALAGCATAPAPAPDASATSAASAAAVPQTAESRRFHALLEQQWEWVLRDRPEMGTWVGDKRYADRLSDMSPAAIARRQAHARKWLATLQGVQRDALSPADRLSLEVALHEAEEGVAALAHPGLQVPRLQALFGIHSMLSGLFRVAPAESERDLAAMVSRMTAYATRVDQEIERLREAERIGWRSPRPAVERVIDGLNAQLVDEPTRHPVYEPFTRPAGAQLQQLRQTWSPRVLEAIRTQVIPAQRRLRDHLVHQHLPQAPATGAMLEYPGGVAAYRHQVRSNTTLALDPKQIHEIGLRETARLHAEMDGIRRAAGFSGDFAAFVKFLHTDKRFFVDSEEALLTRYRDAVKRIEPELPRLFAELPRAPLGVRAYPAFMGPNAAASYSGPDQDGTRAGWFSIPTVGFESKPVWQVESLAVHEGVPGHHLQAARTVELRNLPRFRRGGGFVAYDEGWALYAETLGPELGLYTDPYQRFGHLQMQAFRAARLAVDTGLHALGWSRQQAIDYMVRNAGMDPDEVAFEVDRYLANPGQALGYYLGQMKIIELRDRAKQRLGPKFDIRRFHNAVIDQGSLPLPVLERVIDEWITRERSA